MQSVIPCLILNCIFRSKSERLGRARWPGRRFVVYLRHDPADYHMAIRTSSSYNIVKKMRTGERVTAPETAPQASAKKFNVPDPVPSCSFYLSAIWRISGPVCQHCVVLTPGFAGIQNPISGSRARHAGKSAECLFLENCEF